MHAEPVRSQIRISVVMFALTVSAGAIDAVTFLGLGRALAALATGNVLLLGFGVANAPGITIARPAEALAAFVAGVAAAHAVIVPVIGRGRRWFVVALAGEVGVIAAAGVYATAVSGTQSLPEHARVIVVVLLASAMGWRNRAMAEAAIPDMPTTVMQASLISALTDALSFRSGAARAPALARARRAATILGVFTGGATGALLLRLGPGPAVLVIAGFEACVAALYARAPRLRPPTTDAQTSAAGPQGVRPSG